MIDCAQILAQLSDYLDAEISSEARQIVEAHLAKCRRCSLVYSTTRKTLRIVTECGVFTIPASRSTRLQSHLKELFARGAEGRISTEG